MADTLRVASPPERPVLVFDGDCGFCRYWIRRWQARAGNRADRVEYVPFQSPTIAQRFPEVPRERCARAVQLIQPSGEVVEAAHAVFGTLAILGSAAPLWIYRHVPGGRLVTEGAYRLVADHRPIASRASLLLWGRSGPSTYRVATWLFLRLLGLAYFAAFVSLGLQVRGLIGRDGVLPASDYLTAFATWADQHRMGLDRFRQLPTLCWFASNDAFLQGLTIVGAAVAALLMAGLMPAVMLTLLWAGYLSLAVVSREFLSYQWDALLLETGFLAILIAPWTRVDRLSRALDPPRLARWLLWWLAFRLMLGSGVVKIMSGDETWSGLTALTYHYETQPLPTPLAWYAHQLPRWFQVASTAAVLGIELIAPWFIFAPRHLRTWAAWLFLALQLMIALTGNYAFFNVLTIALCLLLLDDDAFGRRWRSIDEAAAGAAPADLEATSPTIRVRTWLTAAMALIILPVSAAGLAREFRVRLPGSAAVAPLATLIEPFQSVNNYGLFAVMTTTRPEIIVEGSEDGTTWLPYEFKYKPGDLRQAPRWVAPLQPRLDWQMWFAALGRYNQELWFQSFCAGLLQASPPILGLLAHDPFDGRRPQYVRGVLYQYHFTDGASGRFEGTWWKRERVGPYSPELSLSR